MMILRSCLLQVVALLTLLGLPTAHGYDLLLNFTFGFFESPGMPAQDPTVAQVEAIICETQVFWSGVLQEYADNPTVLLQAKDVVVERYVDTDYDETRLKMSFWADVSSACDQPFAASRGVVDLALDESNPNLDEVQYILEHAWKAEGGYFVDVRHYKYRLKWDIDYDQWKAANSDKIVLEEASCSSEIMAQLPAYEECATPVAPNRGADIGGLFPVNPVGNIGPANQPNEPGDSDNPDQPNRAADLGGLLDGAGGETSVPSSAPSIAPTGQRSAPQKEPDSDASEPAPQKDPDLDAGLLYIIVYYTFPEGQDHQEPTEEEIKGLICPTNAFLQEALQDYTNDATVEAAAANIDWEYNRDATEQQVVVRFTLETTTGTQDTVPLATIQAAVDALDTEHALDFVQAYVSTTPGESVFQGVEAATFETEVNDSHNNQASQLPVYECPVPSSAPSSAPSVSALPSLEPSSSPSLSASPSSLPSSSPSFAHSAAPSLSASPSSAPSLSMAPSSAPSLSMAPSSGPSHSFNPSLSPSLSMVPSSFPSLSLRPSSSPSVSVAPSSEPSVSSAPSSAPTDSSPAMVYMTIKYGFEPGKVREPTLEEIKELVCQTNLFLRDTLRNYTEDPTIQVEAAHIDWDHFEEPTQTVVLNFTLNATANEYEELVEPEIVMEGTKVGTRQIIDYIHDYVWTNFEGSLFKWVDFASIERDDQVRNPTSKMPVHECPREDAPSAGPTLSVGPSSAPSVSVAPSLAPTVSAAPSSSPSIGTYSPTPEGSVPNTNDLVYFTLNYGFAGANKEPTDQEIKEVICITNFFYQDILQNRTNDPSVTAGATNINWEYDPEANQAVIITFTLRVLKNDNTEIVPKEIVHSLTDLSTEEVVDYIVHHLWGTEPNSVFQDINSVSFNNVVDEPVPYGKFPTHSCPVPSMAPTVSAAPSVSKAPSSIPSVSSAPSVSAAPSVSSAPSLSSAPTLSPAPSSLPTEDGDFGLPDTNRGVSFSIGSPGTGDPAEPDSTPAPTTRTPAPTLTLPPTEAQRVGGSVERPTVAPTTTTDAPTVSQSPTFPPGKRQQKIESNYIVSNEDGIEEPAIVTEGLEDAWPFFVEHLVENHQRRLLRSGRRLHSTAKLVPGSESIDKIDPIDCPEEAKKGSTCSDVTSSYVMALEDHDDPEEVKDEYERATDEAIEDGRYQAALDLEDPESPLTIGLIPEPEKDSGFPWWLLLLLLLLLLCCCCLLLALYFWDSKDEDSLKSYEKEEEATYMDCTYHDDSEEFVYDFLLEVPKEEKEDPPVQRQRRAAFVPAPSPPVNWESEDDSVASNEEEPEQEVWENEKELEINDDDSIPPPPPPPVFPLIREPRLVPVEQTDDEVSEDEDEAQGYPTDDELSYVNMHIDSTESSRKSDNLFVFDAPPAPIAPQMEDSDSSSSESEAEESYKTEDDETEDQFPEPKLDHGPLFSEPFPVVVESVTTSSNDASATALRMEDEISALTLEHARNSYQQSHLGWNRRNSTRTYGGESKEEEKWGDELEELD